jgi:hypothetical protein
MFLNADPNAYPGRDINHERHKSPSYAFLFFSSFDHMGMKGIAKIRFERRQVKEDVI